MKKRRWTLILASAAAGAVNGLFGGGGGMALLPLLSREPALEGRALFANSVAIILPLCLVSVAVSAFAEPLPLKEALPYLLGGAAGAVVGGKLFRRMPPAWLKRLFALFLFYAGVKYLL
ncbi:MAG: TSUP family transporter [Oscillospiraceae bacterium]